jgi:hypothetical protein
MNAVIAGGQSGELFSECWNNRRVRSVCNVGILYFTKKWILCSFKYRNVVVEMANILLSGLRRKVEKPVI